MYHIPKDARAQKSAQLICNGLEKCLAEKPLREIRVNDIYHNCFVSRSTFYRLFDSITDILDYQCDAIFAEILEIIDRNPFLNSKDRAIHCAKTWLSHPTFIKTLVDNDLGWMIYKTHAKHFDKLKKQYPARIQDGLQSEYFISILSALTSAAMAVYIRSGATMPIEEAYDMVSNCTSVIAKFL